MTCCRSRISTARGATACNAGKIRFWGINGLGETEALHQAVADVPAASIQCCFNLINPSAGAPAPQGFPYQDYRQLIDAAGCRARVDVSGELVDAQRVSRSRGFRAASISRRRGTRIIRRG